MSDNKVKYLEMIQGIIARLGSNSFMLKGWTVAINTGIFVFIENEIKYAYYVVLFIPVLLFWILDSYYLNLERRYRQLYNELIINNNEETLFCLNPKPQSSNNKTSFMQTFLSLTEIGFYLPLAILIALVILFSQ